MLIQQRNEAWAVIREARGLGMELKADVEGGRVRFRPKHLMPFDLHGRLQEHKRDVLMILAALDTHPPPGAAPGTSETCRYCGACRWRNPMAWQCGKCWALWRPSRAAERAAREPGKAG